MSEKPKTKAEMCEQLFRSEKTERRFLRALCDAIEVSLNGELLKHGTPLRPSYLAGLLDTHLGPSSVGNMMSFEFDDDSNLKMEAVSKGNGETGVCCQAGLWKFTEGIKGEQRKRLKEMMLDFANFTERESRKGPKVATKRRTALRYFHPQDGRGNG